MSRYTYSMGTWTQGNPSPEWDEREEFEAYLQRIGYSLLKNRIGQEHGACIELYSSTDRDRFLACVCPDGSYVYEVFIPDFPSLMLFLKDFGSAFSVIGIEAEQERTNEILEKLFNVYHGHEPHAICKSCSPAEWEAWQKRRSAKQ